MVRELLRCARKTEIINTILSQSLSDEQLTALSQNCNYFRDETLCILVKSNLSPKQIEYCHTIFKSSNLSEDKMVAFCSLSEKQMRKIFVFCSNTDNYYGKGKSIVDKILKFWINNMTSRFSLIGRRAKRAALLNAFSSGLTIKQVKLLINPLFSREQIYLLSHAFKSGLDIEQLLPLTDSKLSYEDMSTQIDKMLKSYQLSQLEESAVAYTSRT